MTEIASPTRMPYIDVFSPEFLADPYSFLNAARAESWAAQTPVGMVVLAYDAVQELGADRRLGQPGADLFRLQGVTEGPAFDWWSDMLLCQSGEKHTRIRRIVASAFTTKRVAEYRPQMRSRMDELVATLKPDEPFDFVRAVADPYPIRVFCDILGIPADDINQFGQWSTDLGIVGDFTLAQEYPKMDNAVIGLYAYTEQLIEQRRANLGDDLLSDLLRAEEEGLRLTLDELKSLIVVLLFGGHDTTRQQLGSAMAVFLDKPAQWEALRDNPELASRATEELLRYFPSVIEKTRVATEEIVYRGVTIPQNTFVGFNAGAANRDSACTARPEDFDIARQPVSHLTFGRGPHFCLGSAIARAEVEEFLVALPRRMRTIRLEGEIEWRIPMGIYGPQKVPMSFS